LELRLDRLDGFSGLGNAYKGIPYVEPWLASPSRHEAGDFAKES